MEDQKETFDQEMEKSSRQKNFERGEVPHRSDPANITAGQQLVDPEEDRSLEMADAEERGASYHPGPQGAGAQLDTQQDLSATGEIKH